jgi:hypothetical protein
MAEISVKRHLQNVLVELLYCSDESTWHIAQRCQLIDGLLLLCYFNSTREIRHIIRRNKGNNKITELRTILQKESQNS